MKKIFLTILSLVVITLSMNGHAVSAAQVCCQYYRTDTGLGCSGWMLIDASECNVTNGKDYCGNVKGAGRTNASKCGY